MKGSGGEVNADSDMMIELALEGFAGLYAAKRRCRGSASCSEIR